MRNPPGSRARRAIPTGILEGQDLRMHDILISGLIIGLTSVFKIRQLEENGLSIRKRQRQTPSTRHQGIQKNEQSE